MQIKRKRRFSLAFKHEVVQHSLETTGTQAAVASRYGIHPTLLCRWRRELVQHDEREAKPLENRGPERSDKELERENRRLKKQLERAELELEILKKAEEYFAKGPK